MRYRVILPDGVYDVVPVLAWLIHASTALLMAYFVSLHIDKVIGAAAGLIYFFMLGLVSFLLRLLYSCTLPYSDGRRLMCIAKEELVFRPGSIEHLYRYVPRDLDDPLLAQIAEEMRHLYLAQRQEDREGVENIRQRLRNLIS
jgi:hypothetical protein